ncbi:MAG: response regulator [Deltaproteobacteria bacterium]|nr:response regulator [Deltaproteobacteria bacterium]
MAVFTVFIFFSEFYTYRQARSELQKHARVISTSLWNLNSRGAIEYLTLACKNGDYQELTVIEENGKIFLQVRETGEKGSLKKFLTSIHFIYKLPLSAAIVYEGKTIGRIEAVQYSNAVYSQLYLLFALVLLYLIIHLYSNLLRSKHMLELRVEKRTRELNRLNQSLLQEMKKLQETEAEKRHSEERFQTLADMLPIPVWEADLEKNFTYLNRAGFEIFNLTPKDIENKTSILSLIIPGDREKGIQNYAQIVNGVKSLGNEYWCQARNGRKFPVLIYSSVIINNGRPVGVRGITLDMSERYENEKKQREHEEAMARARKMESLGLLAGGVAHDLNNILSGIVSYPELLLLDLDEDDRLRKPLETIKKSGERAAAIVQDLLTMARGVATIKKALDLNRLIKDYLDSPECKILRQLHPQVTLESRLDPDLFKLKGSAIHIRKVIMNLVTNAVEAMENQGRVTISTDNIYLDTPLQGYTKINPGEYVVCSVADTGSGIAASDLERIFEPFYTKKVMGRSGTGLGLAIVWNVVQDHEGYINVTSNENGTTFKLYFPITREEFTDPEPALSIERYKGNGETILVVDDSESQREISCHILERLGYRVETVASGEEAIARLQEIRVDLVLLDMIMDPGINGRQTYEQIIRIHPGQKAVIISGFAKTTEIEKAQQAGAGVFIKKPVTLKTLGQAIKETLAGNRSGDSL